MRFRPRKILICLISAVSVVVILANLLGDSDSPRNRDGYLVYEGPLPDDQRIPYHVSFDERFKKYFVTELAPISSFRLFQTRLLLPAASTLIAVEPGRDNATGLPSARNWSDNEWYRERYVRRVWRDSTGERSSVWVAEIDRKQEVTGDRILEQMNFVPRRYRNREKSGGGGGGGGGGGEFPVPVKTIYVPSGVDAQTPLGTLVFARERCPVSACNLTTDPVHEKTAHLRLLQADAYFSAFEKKPAGQIWAIWVLESPANTVDFSGPENLVNWTATYRWDSTVVTPYAKFVPFSSDARGRRRNRKPEFQGRNYAANKTKMVAWFVSNCNAKNNRWEFAQELNKYIPVDIFGACGTLDCPRSDQSQCNDRLSADYKFYLSFENSNCDHYITEKFFENGLGNDVVPIVMGARKEDYRKAAPPGSYIHVDDYPSVKELADHLLRLNATDRLYNEYFRWKSTGEFINTKFWCRLCALLHDDDRPDVWYTDFHRWWMHEGACYTEPWTKSNINNNDDNKNNNNENINRS